MQPRRMPYRSAIVAGALLALHIGNGGPLNGTAASQTASPPSQVRPGGWSPATHGNQARPDYARLFALDRVHELRISIDAATFDAMRQDLMSVLPFGIPSARAGAPPARAGAACGPSTPLGAGGPFGKGGGLTSRDPCYFPVTVRHDGHAWTHVGMRYKGNYSLMMGSFSPDGKLSFRLNFDRFEDAHPEIANQRFYGFGLIPLVANLAGIAQGSASPAFQGPVVGGVPMVGSNDDVLFENIGERWPLISRLLADPVYMPRYRAHLRFALGGLYERDRLAARIREWQTLLASAVKSDKRVSMFGGTDDFQTAIATLLTAVDRRRSLIEAALDR